MSIREATCEHMKTLAAAIDALPLAFGFPTVDHGGGNLCLSLMNVTCMECHVHADHDTFWKLTDAEERSAEEPTHA